ncbi:hypothetical protein ACFWIJ_18350, partial [Streptomyces sp. NPDC127079]|uniref:hypothetical protein n=1 Tax=Streptomyces sp. NPDC127079 TaxID=3347132 RepID=UPI00364B54F0
PGGRPGAGGAAGVGVAAAAAHRVLPAAPAPAPLMQGREIDDLEPWDTLLGRIEVEPEDGIALREITDVRIRRKHHDLHVSSNYHAMSSCYLACLRLYDDSGAD